MAWKVHSLTLPLLTSPPLQVKRGLEKLYRRVEKDVSEEVLEVVWGDMQHCLMVQCAKFNKLIQDCYPGEGPAANMAPSGVS